jgi:hypothetical protein
MNKYVILFFISVTLFFSQAVKADESENVSINGTQENETSSLMPNYGNWCGLNHPKDIDNAQDPIDNLDSICKEHDYCYLEKGYLSCECDRNFTDSVALGLIENQFTGKEKLFSHTFRAYFKNSPCSGDHSNKLAPTRAVQNVINNAEEVTKSVINKLPFVGEQAGETPN